VTFLDDLKKRADALRGLQRVDEDTFLRHARATDAACKTTFHYWLELQRQLEVLRPAVPCRYEFDNRHALDGPADGLRYTEFRCDARRLPVRGIELYDHVVISCWVRGGRRVTIDKDFPPDMERLQGRLQQAGIIATSHRVVDGDTGRFVAMRYEFDADVRAGVRLAPDPERGTVQFTVMNFDGLQSIVLEFTANDVDTALLDELSKWWLGEPHGFMQAGRIVRFLDPR
jgi:hypothetical protein